MEDKTLLSDPLTLDNLENVSDLNIETTETLILASETLIFYENMLALELAQTSFLIVIFITILFSGIFKIGR